MSEAIDFTRPLQWILPAPCGRFQALDEFEPGTELAHVEPIENEDGEIVDAVAWPVDDPSKWFLWTGRGVVLGAAELRLGGECEVPIVLVETPEAWVRRHAAGAHLTCCVVDWSGAVVEALSAAWSVVPETRELGTRLERALRDSWARPTWLAKPREVRRAA